MIDARQLFVVWFTNAHPGRAVTFPLTEMDIKAFTISLCEAGFKYARIMNNIYKGLGMWVSESNNVMALCSLSYRYTVEPLLNGHPQGNGMWLLNRSFIYIIILILGL